MNWYPSKQSLETQIGWGEKWGGFYKGDRFGRGYINYGTCLLNVR